MAGLGACGRVLGHVAGCGSMWQRWWQGVGACHRGRGKRYGVRPTAWMETYGRGASCGMVWGHVAGYGLMWQGVEACHNG